MPLPIDSLRRRCAIFVLAVVPLQAIPTPPGTPSAEGHTPTAQLLAAESILKLLLDAKADPRARDLEGRTPHAVARAGNRELLWNAMMEKPLK